jgi:cell division septation protein DedD
MHQEFDPRDLEPALPQPDARRRRIKLGPLLLVVAGIAVFGAITWYAYEAGQRQAAVASMPVIKADNAPTRVRPENPGGLNVPNQDALVLNDPGGTPDRASGGVEKLLPPPEAPLPRPAPTASQTANLPPAIGTSPSRPAASEPPPPAAAPRSTVEAQPAAPPSNSPPAAAPASPSPAAASAAPTQTASVPAVAKPPVTVAKAAAGGRGWRVQLAAVKSEQAASAEWARIEKANPELAELTMTPTRVDLGDKGIFYRVQAGPLADAAAAARLCTELKERKQGCIVVKP